MQSTIGKDNKDVYDIIDSIVNSEDLLECADNLLLFAELALKETNKKKVSDIFRRRLMDSQLVYAVSGLNLTGSIPEIKQDFFYFSGAQAIQQYLSINIDYELSPVKLFKSLVPLGQKILNSFTMPSARQVSEEFIEDILEYLNSSFDFTNKVYGNSNPIFISINNSHLTLNSVTALSNNAGKIRRQYIFLFNVNPDTVFTPEFILLHELGHVVHNRYGSSNAPPESFHRLIKKEILEQLDTYDLCELFADTFAISVICDSAFSQYDPYVDIPLEDKRSYKKYFSELIMQTDI